jgi:hypothetical protein
VGRAAPRFSFSVWALLTAPSLATEPAVTGDPDAISPDGTVQLRSYLPSADTVWFSADCDGLAGCGHVAPIGIRAAIRLMGSEEATIRQLERPHAVRESEGPPPEMRAGLPVRSDAGWLVRCPRCTAPSCRRAR